MAYRPEGWSNIFNLAYKNNKDTHIEFAVQSGMQGIAYEAGADAILEGLKGKAIFHFTEEGKTFRPQYGKVEGLGKGWLVFIEEE